MENGQELPLSLEHDVTGIIDSPDVRSVAVLLSVDTPTHGCLTDDVQGTVGDQGEYIELSPSTPCLQDLTQLLTVTVHHLKEILQDPATNYHPMASSNHHLKWKAGVRSFLLECHFLPVLVSSPVPSQGIRNLYHGFLLSLSSAKLNFSQHLV